MKYILSTLIITLILGNTYGQKHLQVTNNTGGEIAKLESKAGFPQLVIANNHGDIAQIGLAQTTNTAAPDDDDLNLRTLTDFGKIKLRVGGNISGQGLVTINPNSNTNGVFTGAYVGINASSPSAPLTVTNIPGGVTAEFRAGANAETTYVQFTGNSGSSQKGYMGFFTPELNDFKIGTYGGISNGNPTGKIRFQTQNIDRMWIDASGRVFVGDTNTTGSGAFNVCGDITTSGLLTTMVACSSDLRYKKDVSTLSNSLDKITSLTGVNYYWDKDNFPDKGFTSDKQIGLIAQDVEDILPELVNTDEQGYKSVDYVSLTAVLVEAIKEQQLTIDALEKKVDRIAELENKIMALASNE